MQAFFSGCANWFDSSLLLELIKILVLYINMKDSILSVSCLSNHWSLLFSLEKGGQADSLAGCQRMPNAVPASGQPSYEK